MNPQLIKIGFERRIGYSFLGLLAGNFASFVGLLLIATLQSFPMFDFIRHVWWLSLPKALGLFVLFATFSLLGWTVVGLPFVLLLPARIAARLRWPLAVTIGAMLGTFVLFLIFVVFRGGRLDWIRHQQFRQIHPFMSIAAIISGVAFAVYCALVRGALEKEATKRGAPSGTPQFFSILD